MAFQVSPGVSTAEIDLTTRTPIPSLSQGALCSIFKWGPLFEVVTVSSEDDMVERFGKPVGDNFQDWFTGANFLTYANTLRLVRTANTTNARNAVANGTSVLIRNDQEYQNTAAFSGTGTEGRTWIAKHAGDIGNTFKTSICLATRANTPEYLVARFKKERFAEIRKAKLRLSNLKSEELAQMMRGKSKVIKH